MLTLLNVRDQSTAGLGQTEHMFNVRVPAETISVRELIRKRVYQEVREYNRHRPEFFHLLVQPGEAERTRYGFHMREPRSIDPQEQFEKAIEGFQRNGFVVLVDGRQAESLDAQFEARPETSVTFLKLVPLVGG
jgi:hypothetical protein